MRLPCLFIGRFQPLHNGHVYAFTELFDKEEKVIVVIGSAQATHTPVNPLSTSERIQMLQAFFDEEGISCSKYLIIPVPDVHNYRIWVDQIVQYVPPFSRVYTGSKIIERLFTERKIPVTKVAVKDRESLSGTEIRRRIMEGKDWKSLVPKVVADFMEQIGAIQRIRSLRF